MGCSFGVDFQIKNYSTEPIRDLSITNGFNTVYLDSIGLNETKTIFLDFKSDRKHSDGDYRIKYKKGIEEYSSGFGYYSNGMPLDDGYIMKIYNDTIIIDRY